MDVCIYFHTDSESHTLFILARRAGGPQGSNLVFLWMWLWYRRSALFAVPHLFFSRFRFGLQHRSLSLQPEAVRRSPQVHPGDHRARDTGASRFIHQPALKINVWF